MKPTSQQIQNAIADQGDKQPLFTPEELKAHGISRIPAYNEDARAWALSMCQLGLAYHIDDSPEEIISSSTGLPLFTPAECQQLRAILSRMDEDEREVYFSTCIDFTNEQA